MSSSLRQPAPAGSGTSEVAAGKRSSRPAARVPRRNAQGNPDAGAPDLPHADWLYGGDEQAIHQTVWNGRQGHMPTWEGRLSPVDRERS